MPTIFETGLGGLFSSLLGERCACFHCGEQMRKKNALSVVFQGDAKPMCCHGCVAIVQAVIRNDLIIEYLAGKADSLAKTNDA